MRGRESEGGPVKHTEVASSIFRLFNVAKRPWRWAVRHVMDLHPMVANFGWAGLLGGGIGIESGSEYLLGLMFLCASAGSLALVSLRVKPNAFRMMIVGASILLLCLSYRWTIEAKGNNPWSRLLPRHDYSIAVLSEGWEIPRYNRKEIMLYAKRNDDDHAVIPVPIGMHLRISNLQPTPSRIVNWTFSLKDANGDDVPVKVIPEFYYFYAAGGRRVTFLKPLLIETLRTTAVGGMDSVDGMVFFDTPTNFSNPPYRLQVILKDLSGQSQTPAIIDRLDGGNLGPIEFGFRAGVENDDPATWEISGF